MFYVVALVLIGTGILLVARLLFRELDRSWFATHGQEVRGEVIEVRRRRRHAAGPDGMASSWTEYEPVVRFITAEGMSVETRTPSRRRLQHAAGDSVVVSYDPANPSRARLVSANGEARR